MGMGFQFEQHRLGFWGLELGFEKNNLLGNGIRTPLLLHDPLRTQLVMNRDAKVRLGMMKDGVKYG